MRRASFDAFVAPARHGRALWRTLAGIVLIVLIYAGSFAAALGTVAFVLGSERAYDLARRLLEPDAPAETLFLLATFLGMAVAPCAAARLLHRRSPATLFGRGPRVLRDFVLCSLLAGAIYAVAVTAWSTVYDAQPGLPADAWLALLPLTLLGILLQTGAEEVLFRGYLLQQFAARFRSPLAWLVVPAVLFGLVHYSPAMGGPNAWLLVAGATLFGLMAADLTAVSGSIGAAWGFHFANNVLALAVLATDGTITGLALYLTPYAADATGPGRLALIGDLALLLGAWGLCRLAVRR